MNVNATQNLVMKVQIVAFQTVREDTVWSDSLARWMPSASESPSATAMSTIPPTTAVMERVPALRPTTKPMVVMTPEVRPK